MQNLKKKNTVRLDAQKLRFNIYFHLIGCTKGNDWKCLTPVEGRWLLCTVAGLHLSILEGGIDEVRAPLHPPSLVKYIQWVHTALQSNMVNREHHNSNTLAGICFPPVGCRYKIHKPRLINRSTMKSMLCRHLECLTRTTVEVSH